MNDPFGELDPLGGQTRRNPYQTSPATYTANAGISGQYGSNQAPGNPFDTYAGFSPANSHLPTQQQLYNMNYSNTPPPAPYNASYPTAPSTSYPSFSMTGQTPAYNQPSPPGKQASDINPTQPSFGHPMSYGSPFTTQQAYPPAGSMKDYNVHSTEPSVRAPEPTHPPNIAVDAAPRSSIIADFDPFSPHEGTPQFPFSFDSMREQNAATTSSVTSNPSARQASALEDRLGNRRKTQEEQRTQLGFSPDAFLMNTGQNNAQRVGGVSIRDFVSTSESGEMQSDYSKHQKQAEEDTSFYDFFSDSNSNPFVHDEFDNPDDNVSSTSKHSGHQEVDSDDNGLGEREEDEYDITFETGTKLGVLLERVDWVNRAEDKKYQAAVVKLVMENGAADALGVTVGSSVVGINHRDMTDESYATILQLIKTASRPLQMRFKRGTIKKDTTQGAVLTRISNGTFSVGNFTRGNANWDTKYFAFGGTRMDVLQLFVSRAAYHECIISLYEKRTVHTQIQSFRLCRDHKISPIKSKIYKGYGSLHYFSLSVPSLRFIAAKFASEDYSVIKMLWDHTFEAIERRKNSYD